jgi:SH3-like domain-containing protein
MQSFILNKVRRIIGIAVVMGSALTATLAAPAPAPVFAETTTTNCTPTLVARGAVSLRRGPGVGYSPRLNTLSAGDSAQLVGRLRNNSWYRVIFKGQEGWVYSQLVTPSCLSLVPIVPPSPVNTPINTANFRAVPSKVAPGQCSTLSWNVSNVAAVYFVEGQNATGVAGNSSKVVCPQGTTTYLLLVTRRDNSSFSQSATVMVGLDQPNFRTDNTTLIAGQCTTLRWNIDNVAAVYLIQGNSVQGVPGNGTQVVCPQVTTTYVLRVQRRDSTFLERSLVININTAPINPNFRADNTTLNAGQCTTLRWRVDNVTAVYLIQGNSTQGVPGNFAQQVCPQNTTTWVLRVQRRDGSTFDSSVTVVVNNSAINPNFRVDNTTVNPNQCTTLRWNIDNINGIWLWLAGARQGVAGNDTRVVCPGVSTTYRLEILRRDNVTSDFYVTVNVNGSAPPAGPTPQP